MSQHLSDLKPRPDDLVVVPDTMEIPENPGFMVSKVKFLHKPSIIRSGGSIDMLEKSISQHKTFTGKGLLSWLFGDNKQVTEIDLQIAQESGGGIMANESTETNIASNPPRFLRHIRRHGKVSNDIEIVDMLATGGLTVAVDLFPAENKLHFSYALCNPEDRFNKRTASKICETRMDSGDFYVVSDLDEKSPILDNIANAIGKYLTGDIEESTIISARLSKISRRSSLDDLKNILRNINYNF